MQLTGEALANVSASHRFADLVDFFFSLRSASPIAPRTMVASAAQAIFGDPNLPPLEKTGMTVLISDLQKLAEQAKIDCLREAMENITGYVTLTLQEKYLHKYDCFITRFTEGMAAPGAARNTTDSIVEHVLNTIENGKGLLGSRLHFCTEQQKGSRA